jgi:hypothetical protein
MMSPKDVVGVAPGLRSWTTAGVSARKSPVTGLMLYPPSVTVRETMRTCGEAIFSTTASGSSGAKRYSCSEPMTWADHEPSGSFTTRV